MTERGNERIVRDWFEALNRHDLKAMFSLCADDCVFVGSDLSEIDRSEGEKAQAHEFESFPDANTRIETIMSRRDKVMAEFYWKATWKREYMGMPATNKTYDFPCVLIFELENAKIKRIKYYWNTRLLY